MRPLRVARAVLALSTLAAALASLAVAPAAVLAAAPPASTGAAGAQRYVVVPAESQVTYRVGEVFINQGNRFNVAVGVTNAIKGEILIDRSNPRNSRIGTITVDISQFKSDSNRRDNAIRDRWLESGRFPTAEFTPTAIQGLPESYTEGRDVVLQIAGNLKVRDVTRPATFATTMKLDGQALTATATTALRMTDFGFDPPSIFGILRAENDVRLELRLTARASP